MCIATVSSFNAIRENKILAKISEFTVDLYCLYMPCWKKLLMVCFGKSPSVLTCYKYNALRSVLCWSWRCKTLY